MKTCRVCSLEKLETDFRPYQRNGNTYLRRACKECEKKKSKEYYTKNREFCKTLTKQGHRARRIQAAENILIYLSLHPCVDCGESDPVVLEFDHVRGEKKYSISQMLNCSMSWNAILNEIRKCEVRCSNCHRKITALRRNKTAFKKHFKVVDGLLIIRNGGELVYG